MLRLSCIWLAWLVDASLKSLLLGVVIGAAMAVLRVRNTNVRHRAWTAVLLGMLVLPGLVLVVPRVPLPTAFLPRLTLREGQSSGTRSTTDAASPGETDETPEAVCQPKPAPLVVSVKTSPLAGDGTYHAGPGELSEVVRAESPRAEDIGQGAVQRALRPRAVPGEPHGAEGALSSWPLTVVATYASVFAAFAVRLLLGALGRRVWCAGRGVFQLAVSAVCSTAKRGRRPRSRIPVRVSPSF